MYRATDTKLKRDVAIKVLPAAFTEDKERLARFEREAQLLAQLHHPNIASIFGLEESDGVRALIMELVEGPTLAERLESGPLPFNESLSLSLQIAQALEEAHEKGIVHRDLKPQNIKASIEGKVKVLDFGLAKAMDPVGSASGGAGSASQLAASPTLTLGATQMGMILGTAAYMSPEQAKGVAVDKRADIWAFGVVLYEMLTGARLFAGDSVPDTLAGVLRAEIDLAALPASTPPAIRRLLRRCLERNPKNRLHDIADARLVLDEVLHGDAESVATLREPEPHSWTSRALPWAIAALAVATAIVLGLRGGGEVPRAATPLNVFGTLVPEGHFLPRSQSPLLDLSADGQTLLFVAEGERPASIFRRSFDRMAVTRIAGSDGAEHPLLSPDGRWIAFFAGGMLRKLAADGGNSVVVAEAAAPRGASWAPDGSLVYSPLFNSGLWRVAATGGTPVAITQLDAAKGERSHRWPQVLPDGRTVLFTVGLISSPGDYEGATIEAVRLDSGERRTLLAGARMARYTGAGYLVYQRAETLLAVRFDPARLERLGEPFTIQEGVGGETSSGAGYFDVSAAGRVVFAPEAAIPSERVLALVDRAGAETELATPGAAFNQPRFSPDGRTIAASIGTGSSADDDVYLFELAEGRLRRLTFGQGHGAPIWSPDGERIIYTNGLSGKTGMFSKRADGGGEETALHLTSGVNVANSWLPDGRRLALTDAQGSLDIRILDTGEGGAIS
ncbi:MAG TPA: protein kinase, partial [Thermoanaerobaculia bacterium]|nr:protein kinase [Thermoanaerobaculia bacterium]